MGAVFKRKRKDKSGNIKEGKVYWVKYFHNGKPYYESTGTDKWTDAVNYLKQREGEVAMGRQPGIRFDKVMLSELIEDLKEHNKVNDKESPRTKYIESFFEGYPVVDITTAEINKYINCRRETRNPANGTINRELAALRRALNLGAESTPRKVDRVPKIENLEEADPRQGFLNDEDFSAILEEMPEHLRGLVEFAYWTGWRTGQIKKLEWSMVSIKDRKISVPGSITKKQESSYYLPE